jgi:hypothetical protein
MNLEFESCTQRTRGSLALASGACTHVFVFPRSMKQRKSAMFSGRRVDIDRRRSENVGHMKVISTPTATLLLT